MTALAASILLLLLASPAQAAKSCGQKVVDDWYENSVVDGVYPLHCYRDALKLLPDDAQTYSSAPDDIRRALNAAIREQQSSPAPPADDPSASPATGGETGGKADGGDQQTTTSEVLGGGPVSSDGGGTGSGGTPSSGSGGDTSSGIARDVLDKIGPESADALPLPVLIVGGLALLLLAAGSAGLVARRLQARKVRASAPPVPPRRPGPSA
jgi:hypothetical protein